MDRDSEEEPDERDDDSDSSFVAETAPEEENSDSDGGNADRPSCLYLLATLSPQHPKLTWAGKSTPLFTW